MKSDYENWLRTAGYQDNTIVAQLHRVGKVEQAYGDLDLIFDQGGSQKLISDLNYTTADERQNKPNPSKIPFNGNIRNNLQSYKNAAARYFEFRRSTGDPEPAVVPPDAEAGASGSIDPVERQRLSLERDMQNALRRNIGLLEPGLTIIDDGAERNVNSGFIDILCKDHLGALVVIELKAGKTDARVVGQILGYMGDLIDEGENELVRGIIVAHEFDIRTRSASKAISNLDLYRYSVVFEFYKET